MTTMFSKVWIINIALAVLTFFCWVRIWDSRDLEIIIPAQAGMAEEIRPVPSKESMAVARPASSLEYESIVEINLFSPERLFVPKAVEADGGSETEEAAVKEEVRISGEKVVLYGVVVLDDFKKALINNPARKPGDRDFLWITEGETLSNLRVTRIDPEQLILDDGAAHYRIGLYDPGKERQKASAPSRAASQQRPTPQVISADPAPAAPVARASTGTTASAKRLPADAQKQAVGGDDEYEIIETPFGEIRRKKTR